MSLYYEPLGTGCKKGRTRVDGLKRDRHRHRYIQGGIPCERSVRNGLNVTRSSAVLKPNPIMLTRMTNSALESSVPVSSVSRVKVPVLMASNTPRTSAIVRNTGSSKLANGYAGVKTLNADTAYPRARYPANPIVAIPAPYADPR